MKGNLIKTENGDFWLTYFRKGTSRSGHRILKEDIQEFMNDITIDWFKESGALERYTERTIVEEHERYRAFQRGYKKGYEHGTQYRKFDKARRMVLAGMSDEEIKKDLDEMNKEDLMGLHQDGRPDNMPKGSEITD